MIQSSVSKTKQKVRKLYIEKTHTHTKAKLPALPWLHDYLEIHGLKVDTVGGKRDSKKETPKLESRIEK